MSDHEHWRDVKYFPINATLGNNTIFHYTYGLLGNWSRRMCMVHMNGTHRWYTWMVHTDGTHDGTHGWYTWWYTRMVHTDGTHGWYTWMEHMDGIHAWHTWMVHMDGTHRWYPWMAHMDGTYRWYTQMVPMNGTHGWYTRMSASHTSFRCRRWSCWTPEWLSYLAAASCQSHNQMLSPLLCQGSEIYSKQYILFNIVW